MVVGSVGFSGVPGLEPPELASQENGSGPGKKGDKRG